MANPAGAKGEGWGISDLEIKVIKRFGFWKRRWDVVLGVQRTLDLVYKSPNEQFSVGRVYEMDPGGLGTTLPPVGEEYSILWEGFLKNPDRSHAAVVRFRLTSGDESALFIKLYGLGDAFRNVSIHKTSSRKRVRETLRCVHKTSRIVSKRCHTASPCRKRINCG